MAFFLSSFLKDWRRKARDPVGFALWLGIPGCIMLLISLAFGGARTGAMKPQGLVLIADYDQTLVSSFLKGALGQGQLGDFFRTENVEEADGRRRMNKGDAAALVVIPQGFGEAVLRNRPVALKLVLNPSQRILPGMLKEVLVMGTEAVHYVHLVGGEPLREMTGASGRPSDLDISRLSVKLTRLGDSLRKYINPPAIDLDETAGAAPKQASKPLNIPLLFFPGLFFLTLLFLTQSVASDIWEEERTGTLRRICSTRQTIAVFLAGKLAVAIALAAAVEVVVLALGHWFLEVPVANAPLALLWVALSTAALYMVMGHLVLLPATEQGGHMATSLFLFPSMMLGGGMFPFEIMPKTMATVGRLTPVGWMVTELSAILNGKAGTAGVCVAAAGLAAVSAVLFWLLCRRVDRKFVTG